VKRAGEVLALRQVDRRLAADRGVHLSDERGRHGDPCDTTEVRRRDEAADVGRAAAAEGNDGAVAVEAQLAPQPLDDLRGVAWVSVPTTLVGQVDAAIGGKTAIDLSQGKNLAGAFHWPARAVIDPATLTTLPEEQHLEGMAEVVKTGLLAGKPLWELPTPTLVQRCAAYKAALCLRDPADQGERAVLNLGHTFAHALEAAAGYEGVSHGRAVALGLLAALRLSGRPTDVVEHLLTPQPVRVDRERAWDALRRDKKSRGGELRLVLLGEDGPLVETRPEADVRAALDELIAE